jgi:hypothetical protein
MAAAGSGQRKKKENSTPLHKCPSSAYIAQGEAGTGANGTVLGSPALLSFARERERETQPLPLTLNDGPLVCQAPLQPPIVCFALRATDDRRAFLLVHGF